MTASEELALLETAYQNALTGGGVTSYSIEGRSVTRDIRWLSERIDLLRAVVARESASGSCPVAKFRDTDR